jgi:hypothetical protein
MKQAPRHLAGLVVAIYPCRLVMIVCDCLAAVLSVRYAWPSGLGWRSHSAHTCFDGLAERTVAVAMPSNNALKLTAPAIRSAAA